MRADRRTGGHGYFGSASDPDQENIKCMGPDTHPSTFFILFGESNILYEYVQLSLKCK